VLTFIFSASLASSLPKLLVAAAPHDALAFANPVLQFVWLSVAVDFVSYCMHFCQHKLRFWWEAHKFHHCATELNVITTARAHPLDHAFQLLFLAVPTALLGGSMIQFLLLNIVMAMHAGLTHSMVAWNFGWVGRWLLVSPIAHRIHHSEMPEHRDKNLGSVFIFWDRIFGSYYGGPVINDHVGVDDNVYNRGLVTDFVECGVRVYTTIVAVPRRLLPSTGSER
jgi:sterol desaturase/sphingolipid hydroxylase (fatty acid hydroxylase superfamily)